MMIKRKLKRKVKNEGMQPVNTPLGLTQDEIDAIMSGGQDVGATPMAEDKPEQKDEFAEFTFAEVVDLVMLEGKRARMSSWPEGEFIFRTDTDTLGIHKDNKDFTYFNIRKVDVESKDWELV